MTYIATFYSHFGAIRYKKALTALGASARTMPVPRNLSSSCGTCVRYEAEKFCPMPEGPDSFEELEKIVRVSGEDYELLYASEEF